MRVEPAAILLKSQLRLAISQAELMMLFASSVQLYWLGSETSVTKQKARTVPCVRQAESHGFSVPLANRMQALPAAFSKLEPRTAWALRVEGDEPQERGKSSLRSGLPSP